MSKESIRERRKKDRLEQRKRTLLATCAVAIVLLVIVVTFESNNNKKDPKIIESTSATENTANIGTETEIQDLEYVPVGDVNFKNEFEAHETDETITPSSDDVVSEHSILIDETTDEIMVCKDAYAKVSPASMTKIMTVLVAAEHLDSMDRLDDDFTMTLEYTDYAYVNDCSTAGFLDGEKIKVKDLFYGTILPSGGEAAAALAAYTAGSQEEFAKMMNEKLDELGLSDTAHFTNCIGIYDENHYCSVYDMAMIIKAAMENDFVREVMSAHTYVTSSTKEHPDGITLSNLFLRRIEDHIEGGVVMSAKTGYVVQSGNCAASYFVSESGIPYICVTANSTSGWRCIYDHVALYKMTK